MSIFYDQRDDELTGTHRGPGNLRTSVDRRTGERFHGPFSDGPQRSVHSSGAMVYLLGMGAATLTGSAFVIGGMVARASGFGAVILAASVPIGALLWAIAISVMHRG